MKFRTYTLIDNSPDPISGEQLAPAERFQHVVRQAQRDEELGFDAYGVGERHAQRFISSSPPVVLSYLAAVDLSEPHLGVGPSRTSAPAASRRGSPPSPPAGRTAPGH